MERLKTVNIAEEIKAIQKEQKAFIEKVVQSLKKQQKSVEQDIATMNEKIPEAIRRGYIFSAEKLVELIQSKEEKRQELEKRNKGKEKALQSVKISNTEMQKFINMIPNWKEEFASVEVPTKQMLLSSLIERIEAKDDDIKIRFRIRLDDFLSNDNLIQ